MKIYRAEYEIQNTADLESRLSENFGTPENTDQGVVFENKIDLVFKKIYICDDNQKRLIEQCIASPLYLLSTLSLGIATWSRIIGFTAESTLISTILSILYLLGGLTLFLWPIFLSSIQPDAFFPDESTHELFQTPVTLPVLFREQFNVSPVVYLNGIFTVILAAPLIMPEFSITIVPVLILLGITLPFVAKSRLNPATNQIVILAVVSLWPFGLTLGNLHTHVQRSKFLEQEREFVSMMESLPIVTHEMRDIIWFTVENPIIRLIILNILMVFLLLYLVPKLLSSAISTENVFHLSSLITSQIFFRVGVSSLLFIYFTIPLIIFASLFYRPHILQFDSTIEFIVAYWALIVVLPLSVIRWIYTKRREKDQLRDIINSRDPIMSVDEVPVIIKDKNESSAFPIQEIDANEYIVVDQELENQMDRDELLAICYHELYHLENNIYRLQKISELPIVGYLLFFIFVNPVLIHKEEFRADEYAAKNVSREAIVSALEKTESMNGGPSDTDVGQFVDEEGSWATFVLFWKSPPILQLYRPERRVRINRLQAPSSNF
jgi:Zn-dependent protease with chaperone function